MSDRALARTLAASIDSAVALAVIESARVLWAAPELRTTAAFFSLMFAVAGVAIVVVFAVVLIVCAIKWPPLARRALGGTAALAALVALFAPSLSQRASVALLLVGVSAARALLAPPAPARFGRVASAVFCVLFAPVALATSDSLRTAAIERGPFTRAALGPLAARWPAPAIGDPPRPVAIAPRPSAPWTTPLTLVVELDAIAPEAALAMPSTRLIARNSVVFVDARRATQGRSALGDWRARFDHGHDGGAWHARCEWAPRGPSFEPCATRALSTRAPLVLWLRTSVADPRRVDGALRAVLTLAHQRTPLSSAIVALTSQRAPEDPSRSTRALVLLSERTLRPSLTRGAVRVDELARSIDVLVSSRADPLLDLARRRVPWFDRTVIVRGGLGGPQTYSAHNGRYSLVLTPERWGVALYDHELDPGERVNRADALPSLTRAMTRALAAP